MKKVLSITLSLLMIFSLVVFAGAAEAKTETIKIGFFAPVSAASAAADGESALNSAKLAVKLVNENGGINGTQVELVDFDDGLDTTQAANIAERLAGDNSIAAVVSGSYSGPTKVAAPIFQEAGKLMVSAYAVHPDVTGAGDLIFSQSFPGAVQATGAAVVAAEQLKATKVAIIYNNADAYSTGIYNTFVAEAANQGLEIVSETTFTDETNDFSVQVAAAKDAGADLVFLPIYYTPASLILATAKSMDYAPVFFGVDGMDGILTMEGFDASLAEGVFMLTPFSADAQDERTQSFVASYKELTGEIPNQFAADCYDAVWALWNASLSAGIDGSTSPEDACELLIEQFTGDFEAIGLTGTMTWDETGAVTKTPTAVVIQDGAYVGFNG